MRKTLYNARFNTLGLREISEAEYEERGVPLWVPEPIRAQMCLHVKGWITAKVNESFVSAGFNLKEWTRRGGACPRVYGMSNPLTGFVGQAKSDGNIIFEIGWDLRKCYWRETDGGHESFGTEGQYTYYELLTDPAILGIGYDRFTEEQLKLFKQNKEFKESFDEDFNLLLFLRPSDEEVMEVAEDK